MTSNRKQTICAICGRKLSFWFTALKKYNGKKICSSCAMKTFKNEIKSPKKKISETRATCQSCGNVWYYGKSEQLDNLSGQLSNLGKSMMCCSGCTPAVLIPDQKVTDLNRCSKCGSKAVKKEKVTHVVE